MLTESHIRKIIDECREIGDSGLGNGINAFIPCLEIDILQPPCDFLGVHGNPAIFVNEQTYKLLGGQHENWIANRTIAFKDSFLKSAVIQIIGAAVHETGHAFNVAAGIVNTEANACIFEIEVMRKLHVTGTLRRYGCSGSDLQSFFISRMADYQKGVHESNYLKALTETIQKDVEKPKEKSLLARKFVNDRYGFFDRSWVKEQEIIAERMGAVYRS